MAEAQETTGVGHTLLGVNAFQGSVDKLDRAVDKLSSAADKLTASASRGSRGAGGVAGLASNWLLGKANGGGATFNGVPASGTADPASTNGDPTHRADGPAQTPGWAQAAGNFTQAMAKGNGGLSSPQKAFNVGNAVGGTKMGLAAAAGSAGLGVLSWAARNGASSQDMYNWNMLGGTATRMFNQGIGGVAGPSFGMSGVAGSQNAQDFYGSMYLLNSQSGYLQGSAQSTKMQAQAGAMGYLNPTTNMTANTQALIGLSSNSTVNLMRAFGINTYGNDPTQIARQLLDRLGAPKGKIDPKIIQMVLAPQSGLSTTLGNMVAAGALTPDQADAVKTAAYNILVAQNHGMSSNQLDTLTQQAAGKPGDSSTKSAQARLKALGIGTTTAQTVMNRNANQTQDSVSQLGSFSSALSTSTRMLTGFANILKSIPGVEKAAGANSGGGGGWMGALLGGAGFLSGGGLTTLGAIGSGFSGAGLNLLGKGDGAISLLGGSSSLGGGDVSMAGEAYSELSVLAASGPKGPGFVGAGMTASAGYPSTGTSGSTGSTPGSLSGSSGYSSAPSGGTSSSGGNGSPSYGTSQGVPLGRVSPAQAIARIRSLMARHVDIGVGLCQMNAHSVYGIGNGAASAIAAWNAARYKHPMSDPPPVGAFVYWGGGYGHVAIYAGGGKVYSPGGPGDLSHWVLCSVDAITKGWGKPLLGWSEDNNGVRVVKPSTAPKTNTHHNGHTSGGNAHSTGGHTMTGRGAQSDGVLDPYLSGGSSGAISMDKSGLIIPGGGAAAASAGATLTRRGSSHAGPQIIFGNGSVQITIQGGAQGVTAATGRALGREFAQTLAQDTRIKALMAGTRG